MLSNIENEINNELNMDIHLDIKNPYLNKEIKF